MKALLDDKGVVTHLGDHYFSVSFASGPEQLFHIKELSKSDQKRLVPGAPVRLLVTRQTMADGSVVRMQSITVEDNP